MKHSYSFGLLVAVITFIGCSNSDDTENFNPHSTEIGFNVEKINKIKTRAGYDRPEDITRSDPGFGVYIVDDPAMLTSSGNRADNHQIKWGGANWFNQTTQTNNTQLLWPEGQSISAYAYCPFQNDIINVKEIPIQIKLEQNTLSNLKASDFIRAKTINCLPNGTNNVPLTFYHQLSKIKFNISWNDSQEVGNLQEVSIHSVRWQGKHNLSTGETSTSPTYLGNVKGYIYNKTTTSATMEVITMPQTIQAGKFASIKTNLKGQDVYYILRLSHDLDLKSNTQYNFNIYLNTPSDEIVITPTPQQIMDWGEVETGDWNIDANIKKLNTLTARLTVNSFGLKFEVTPEFPLHEDSDIKILLDSKYYFHNNLSYWYQTAMMTPEEQQVGNKTYKLSLRQSGSSEEGTTVEDELMQYTIVPQEIFIPKTITITPEYNKEEGLITLKSNHNVESDITYRVSQYTDDWGSMSVSEEAKLLSGTNQSNTIDVKTWEKSKNVVISLIYIDSDTRYDHCQVIRNNFFYHLEGSFWGVSHPDENGVQDYELHIVL